MVTSKYVYSYSYNVAPYKYQFHPKNETEMSGFRIVLITKTRRATVFIYERFLLNNVVNIDLHTLNIFKLVKCNTINEF